MESSFVFVQHLAISVLPIVLKWCRKGRKKDSGEERVTAKSKPMMNLVSRCSERTLDVLASIASESLGKTRHESQFLLRSRTEQHHRTGRLFKDAYSSIYSEWNAGEKWSSQEWKSDEVMEDRTGRPVVFAQHTDKFIIENDNMDSYTEAESEMSLESRSFLHSVHDQVRKRQNQSSKYATKDSDKHFVIWRMFMSSPLQASVFMVKKYSDNNLLQPTGGVNSIPHTSHFLMLHNTNFNVTSTLAQVWRAAHISLHPIFMRSWCGCFDSLRFSLLLLVVHLPSYLHFHPPGR